MRNPRIKKYMKKVLKDRHTVYLQEVIRDIEAEISLKKKEVRASGGLTGPKLLPVVKNRVRSLMPQFGFRCVERSYTYKPKCKGGLYVRVDPEANYITDITDNIGGL